MKPWVSAWPPAGAGARMRGQVVARRGRRDRGGRGHADRPADLLAGVDQPRGDAGVGENTAPGGEAKTGDPEGSDADSAVREVPRDVPGPASLPGPDPDVLRADPLEGDEDPSKDMGRS